MMTRLFAGCWLCLIVLLSATSNGRSQKAYDVVTYSATVGTKSIVLAFADGYPEASTVTIKDSATKRTMELQPDGSGEMRFVGKKRDAGTVVLKMDPYEAAPSKVAGTLTVDGKSETFQMKKK